MWWWWWWWGGGFVVVRFLLCREASFVQPAEPAELDAERHM
jgi:hypothetical protein